MVSHSPEDATPRTAVVALPEGHSNIALQTRGSTSPVTEITTDGLQFIRQSIESTGISPEATEILMCSWRKSTRQQYKGYLELWTRFCLKNGFQPCAPQINEVIDYLLSLFKSGLGYSGINTARSALSSVLSLHDGVSLGSHPLVIRFMKGVFEQRPSLPRYTATWDVNIVLSYFKALPLAEHLSLKELTLKLASLLVILSGQRLQTIHLLHIDHMILQENKVIFQVKGLVKQSKPGRHIKDLEFEVYTPDERLCVVLCLKEYLKRTSVIRGQQKQLLLSFVKPHSAVSKDTLSRWIKTIMEKAGVDMNIFKTHSTRSASTSAASLLGVNIQTIMNTAGWTNARTFATFYHKPIEGLANFSQALLHNVI